MAAAARHHVVKPDATASVSKSLQKNSTVSSTASDASKGLAPAESAHDAAKRMMEMGLGSSRSKSQIVDTSILATWLHKYARAGDMFVNFMIVVNSIQLGLRIEVNSGGWITLWAVLEQLFTIIFLTEMVVKIYGLRLKYFYSGWNWLDASLVFVAVLDNWILVFFLDGSQIERISVLRLVRLYRLARIFRVLRMSRDVATIVGGIAASLKGMVPIGTVLFLSIYAFSIGCVDTIGKEDWDDFDNSKYFGNLTNAWMTLFNLSMMTEWGEIMRPMWKERPSYVPVFILFTIVNSFGIMNVIIGVILDNTQAASQKVAEEEQEKAKRGQMESIYNIAHLIESMDSDGDRMISAAELTGDAVQDIAGHLALPHGFTPAEFFTMLDNDGSESLSPQEFISAMFRLVHCDTFQNMCLTKLTLNQLILSMKQSEKRADKEFKEIRRSLRLLLGQDDPTSPISASPRAADGKGVGWERESSHELPAKTAAHDSQSRFTDEMFSKHREAMADIRSSLEKAERLWLRELRPETGKEGAAERTAPAPPLIAASGDTVDVLGSEDTLKESGKDSGDPLLVECPSSEAKKEDVEMPPSGGPSPDSMEFGDIPQESACVQGIDLNMVNI